MTEGRFRELVGNVLAPMLGARVDSSSLPSTSREKSVSYFEGPTSIAVKLTADGRYRLVLRRAKPFQDDEKRLAEDFISEAAKLIPASDQPYFDELAQALPRWVIARHLAPRDQLKDVLERLERWSSETYEGHRITCALGISPTSSGSGLDAVDYWDQSFAPVLSNGYDTLVEIGADLQISGLVQLRTPCEITYTPYRLGHIAHWTKADDRVAVVLNAQGEILVFKEGLLRFAKRSGQWSHFVHDLAVRTMAPSGGRVLRKAVYVSALDVSFARTGGCIAIVQSSKADEFPDLVDEGDRLLSESSFKAKLLRAATSSPFNRLDRRLRQELLALDGAAVVDHEGTVLAAGAIVDVPSGSTGGGRRAAAVRLSQLGVALKISADGPIEIFENGANEAVLQVT